MNTIRQTNTEVRSGLVVNWFRFYNLTESSEIITQSDLGCNESFVEALTDDQCEQLTRESIESMEAAFKEKFG